MLPAFRFICQFKRLYNGTGLLQQSCFASIHAFARKVAPSYIFPYSIPVLASFNLISLPFHWYKSRVELLAMMSHAQSFVAGSHLSKLQNNFVSGEEMLGIIKSVRYELEGPNHRWLNISISTDNRLLNPEGIFLILVNAFVHDGYIAECYEYIFMIEGVKLLKKRYPLLNVIGVQCVSSANSVEIYSDVLKTIMDEFISFPVLLLDKKLIEVTDSIAYLLFEGATSQHFYIKTDAELEFLKKAIDELSVIQKENMSEKFSSDGVNQHATIEEPYAATSFRNFLLYNAVSLAVDEDGGRIFVSDSNHHRIIVIDSDGRILDSIGSSPGFVDADFESAKLCRPAGSFYNVSDGCLYFLDSENNAIRRADMTKRLVETLYPIPKFSGIWDQISSAWTWILLSSGFAKESTKTEELCFDSINFPWHLLNSEDELIIICHSFAVAWTISMSTWKLKEVKKGFLNIFESYENLIMEKLSCLRNACTALPQKFSRLDFSEKIHYAHLISSVGSFHDNVITYDAVGQSLQKYNMKSKGISHIHFSNMGALGVPYWLIYPIERVFSSGGCYFKQSSEHAHSFVVLPGRCDIRVNVEIPKDTVLAAPLDENCIWRQARGSAAEVSVSEENDKVGVAQQWFDELDNLAFINPEVECLEFSKVDKSLGTSFQDTGKTSHLNCVVNVSPGTSEVIVLAALYLKPNPTLSFEEAKNLLNLQMHEGGMLERECISLFLEKCRNISKIIFTKPLQLRIKLDCGDHPAALTSKETILTNTRLELSVAVD